MVVDGFFRKTDDFEKDGNASFRHPPGHHRIVSVSRQASLLIAILQPSSLLSQRLSDQS